VLAVDLKLSSLAKKFRREQFDSLDEGRRRPEAHLFYCVPAKEPAKGGAGDFLI
jgi:hypothetical protein